MNDTRLACILGCWLILLCSCGQNAGNNQQDNRTPGPGKRWAAGPFDTVLDGKQVHLYTLENKNGLKMTLTNYGARVVSFLVPFAGKEALDITLGYDSIRSYLVNPEAYYGATIGRYGNRIAAGRFTLGGVSYQVSQNDGVNSLHGGKQGFNARVWETRQNSQHELSFSYTSADGEEGYPGTLTTNVWYTLTDSNTLRIRYEATSDKTTVCNLTNHAYWNLNGAGSGTINGHLLTIRASRYTPVDSTLIPTGQLAGVAATPFDFTRLAAIGARLEAPDPQLKNGKGYDHNFVLDSFTPDRLTYAATVTGDYTGITMEVFTTEPGLQFYGGNFLQGLPGKAGKPYGYRGAFCLETQHFPDSPNEPAFPSTMLEAGKTYKSMTEYRFYFK